MGIDPKIFGPSFWGALHLACLGAENPEKVREFITLYQYVLPCAGCRHHFSQLLQDFPIPEEGDLFEWSIEAHNIVNKSLGKPEITVEEAMYTWVYSKVEQPPKKNYTPHILIILAIIISIIIYLKVTR